MEIFDQFRGLIGIALLILLAWGLSEDRRGRPSWGWIAGAVALQAFLALLIVRVPIVWDAVTLANEIVAAIERATAFGKNFGLTYSNTRREAPEKILAYAKDSVHMMYLRLGYFTPDTEVPVSAHLFHQKSYEGQCERF